jgi:hypothetical protein
MKTKKQTGKKTILQAQRTAVLLIIALMFIMLASCGTEAPVGETVQPTEPPVVNDEQGNGAAQDNAESQSSQSETQEIGQGSTVFTLEVTDDTEAVTTWNVFTDEATVGAALYELGVIDNVDFFVEVNGLTADFDADEAWWAFYINGEMAMEGVGTTDIEPGVTYSFVYTIGWG